MTHWEGLEESVDAIGEIADKAERNTPFVLRAIGETIMTDIKQNKAGKGVPQDEGILKSTGTVSGGEQVFNPEVKLSFGGPAAPYALVQHERMDFHHEIGEPRYLVRGLHRFQANKGFEKSAKALMDSVVRQVAMGGTNPRNVMDPFVRR